MDEVEFKSRIGFDSLTKDDLWDIAFSLAEAVASEYNAPKFPGSQLLTTEQATIAMYLNKEEVFKDLGIAPEI